MTAATARRRSRGRATWSSLAALGALAVATSVGACGGTTEDLEPAGSCELVSDESLTEMTGTDDLFVTGGHLPAETRSSLSCDVLQSGSPVDVVRILALDLAGAEARANVEEARRGQKEADACESIESLPQDRGYLCRRADEPGIDASVALDDRVVRFTFAEAAQLDAVSPDSVLRWAEDVDTRIAELDAAD